MTEHAGRKKRALWGLASDVGGQFLWTLATLVATPLILRYTSESLYGFWIASLSFLAYLGLLDVGLGISLTRAVAGLQAASDSKAINRLASCAFVSFGLVAIVFLTLGLTVSFYVAGWCKVPDAEAAVVTRAFRIIVVAGALGMPLSPFVALLLGVQRMAVVNSVRSIASLLGLGLALILLQKGMSVIALAISQVFSTLLSGLVCYLLCRLKYARWLHISLAYINRVDMVRLWSFGGYFQLGRIANTVALSADPIIIAAVLGAAFVTPYTLTSKLAVFLSITIASKLPIAIFPALSQMFAQGETEKLRHVFITLASYSTRLATVGAVFLLGANRSFVRLWVGDEMYGGALLNIAFVSWVLLDTVFRGLGVMMQTSGDIRPWSIISVAEALLNIGLSLWLIRSLGLFGVAIATSIARTLTIGILIPVLTCRRLEFPLRRFFRIGILQPMGRSVLATGVIAGCMFWIPVAHGWPWLLSLIALLFLSNVLSFEGVAFLRLSQGPWRARLREAFGGGG